MNAPADSPQPTTLVGHAHLDLAWLWTPNEARVEALDTARSAVSLLGEHPTASFVMSQAVTYSWIQDDDPATFRAIRDLVDAGRWEAVGGWWAEPDLFGASPESIAKHLEVGQEAFASLVGQPCAIGFAPDTFGHPEWLPRLLLDVGIDTYVITRPGAHEANLPPVFRWRGGDGAEVVVVRPSQYFGEPNTDVSGLSFYGVGNHGGGPTRANLRSADAMCADGVAVHGTIASWRDRRSFADLPVVEGDLVHHARGCYSTMISFKERMRSVERLLLASEASSEDWQTLAFWQFHDVLAGTSVPEVYEQAYADLTRLEAKFARPVPGLTEAWTFVPRQRIDEGRPVRLREVSGEPWSGWLPVRWRTGQLAAAIEVDDHPSVLRRVEQHGAGWVLDGLVKVSLAAHEELDLRWRPIPGPPPELPPVEPGISLAILEDGSDTWGHGIEGFGDEAAPSGRTTLHLAGGPDGLVEVWGDWQEPNRVLKLCIPRRLLQLDAPAGNERGEMPGREMDGPVWGRVWSYDRTDDALRITLRRSPPYAMHDPMREVPGARHRYTDLGWFTSRFWLTPQPTGLPPQVTTL